MQAVLIALALLVIALVGIYLLLKSMGQNGIEAAAPGSCKSGRCGVQAPSGTDAQEQYVQVDEIKRAPQRQQDSL